MPRNDGSGRLVPAARADWQSGVLESGSAREVACGVVFAPGALDPTSRRPTQDTAPMSFGLAQGPQSVVGRITLW